MQEILELFRNALMILLDQPETSPEKTSLILSDSLVNVGKHTALCKLSIDFRVFIAERLNGIIQLRSSCLQLQDCRKTTDAGIEAVSAFLENELDGTVSKYKAA